MFRLIEKRSKIKLEREQIAGFELTGEAPKKDKVNGEAREGALGQKGPAPVKGKGKSKKDRAREKALKDAK